MDIQHLFFTRLLLGLLFTPIYKILLLFSFTEKMFHYYGLVSGRFHVFYLMRMDERSFIISQPEYSFLQEHLIGSALIT